MRFKEAELYCFPKTRATVLVLLVKLSRLLLTRSGDKFFDLSLPFYFLSHTISLSMAQQFDYSIVAREDRGHWLAGKLRRKGYSVALIDASSSLGRWAPEDLEGPFGIMRSPNLSAKQWAKTTEGHITKNSDRGFVVWLENKALELKGLNFAYHKTIHPELALAENYFSETDGASPDKVQLYNEKLNLTDFSKNWPIQLGHAFSSNINYPNARAIHPKRPFPLFYNYFVRETSRYSNEQSLLRLEQEALCVFPNSVLKDVSVDERNKIEGFEIQSGSHSEIVRSKNWIWLLSSEETEFLNSELYNKLYNVPSVKSEWNWMKTRMKFQDSENLDQIPDQLLMIQDLHLPWSHDNFVQVLRNGTDNEFDFWVKVPSIERFRKEYLDNIQRQVLQKFKNRIPGIELSKLQMPAEYYYSNEELGPSPFSLYDEKSLKSFSPKKWKNLTFDGPEFQSRLDLGYRLMKQQRSVKEWLPTEVSGGRSLHKTRDGSPLDA